MKVNDIPVYGSRSEGKCPSEGIEMVSAFNWLRVNHPRYWAVAVHIRNEGLRSHAQVRKIKSEGGFVKGAADISIAGCPSLVCEMKSCSNSARLSPEQKKYLQAAKDVGAFACVALGAEGFVRAFYDWERLQPKNKAG